MLKINQRTVKESQGIRPFQRAAIDALNSNAQIIIVEAPVGAGKSYIVRQLVEHWTGAVVLTYPTKILMDAQGKALKSEFPDSIMWPYETGIPGNQSPTIFHYSSDALISFLKGQGINYHIDRSELIDQVLHQQFWASSKNILITSPDVLHLLFNIKAYRGSKRLISFLTKSLIVFDEFHLYIGLKNFSRLLDNLFEYGISKIILLSATPVISEEMLEIFGKYETLKIDFLESIGGAEDTTFNYPLNLEFVNCRFTKKDELLKALSQYIPVLPKPLAIILDSVFRLRHILPLIKKEFGDRWNIVEHSGFLKDRVFLDDKTILIGTSSIEVGINMVFKSLITEVSYWTSAIQRIGRAGRFQEGNVVILTTKNMNPYITGKTSLDRYELENDVIKSALKDIKMTHVCGDMFRGDIYPFLIYDAESKRLTSYTESIFAMYEPKRWINDWRTLSNGEKEKQLLKYTKSQDEIAEILLRDKLFPFWGVMEGRLRDVYEKISIHHDDNELTVLCENTNARFYFEGGI